MIRSTLELLILHALFGAAGYAAFHYLHAPQLGEALLSIVLAYNLVLPLYARARGDYDALDLWLFLLPLSVFQVAPDWMLSQLLGILVFPDLGAPRLGSVPVYMAGLWVAPLFWAVWLGRRSVWLVAALALAIFGGAEYFARPLHLWYAQGVREYGGVALYVLLPEALLGLATGYAYLRSRDAAGLARPFIAALVSVFYSGALVMAYFLSERADWHLHVG